LHTDTRKKFTDSKMPFFSTYDDKYRNEVIALMILVLNDSKCVNNRIINK